MTAKKKSLKEEEEEEEEGGEDEEDAKIDCWFTLDFFLSLLQTRASPAISRLLLLIVLLEKSHVWTLMLAEFVLKLGFKVRFVR